MSKNKSCFQAILHRVVITALAVFAIISTSHAQTPLDGLSEIEMDGLRMMSGIVVVQLQRGADVFHPERSLPTGVSFAGRLLDPARTNLYGGRSFTKQFNSTRDLTRAEDELTRVVYVRFDGPIDPRRIASRLMKDPQIAFAEPWYVGQLHADPNDPLYSQQAALRTMHLPEAWDIETGSNKIVIGISDNGVDQSHEDISGNLWTNAGEIPDNGIDDDNNGYVDDHQGFNFSYKDDGTAPGNTTNPRAAGHGTKVAGIAGAHTNNELGMSGAGYKCMIFPLKTARIDGGGIIYGYQSLLYSADMGFDVVNTSWGIVKPPSPIDQSVINYCLAKGLVVVASAGNHGTGLSGTGWSLLNFPAAYDGVVGVGETNSEDKLIQTTGLGINATVMAPGNRTLATTNGGGYTASSVTGTSFASPLAAGVVGLIMSRYPALSARQIAAHLRRTADNIWRWNPAYAPVLPGRVNAFNAVTVDPMSHAALRISSVTRRHTDGSTADRFRAGDTLLFNYTLTNDLGPTGDLTVTLGVADDDGWSVTILDDMVLTDGIATGSSAMVGEFRIVINSFSELPLVLGLLCEDDATYAESLLDYLQPPSEMTTFMNESLVYSVGDDGTFGFSSNLTTRRGVGFNWLEGYWLLSPSGFLFTEGGRRVLKAYNNITNRSEFSVEKPFAEPDRDRGVMSDVGAQPEREVGVRVYQRYTFPSITSQTTVISVSLENRSSENLSDIAAGYFLDWDVGYAGQENFTRLAPEALPTTFRELGVAQLFDRENVDAAVVCAIVTTELDFQPQSAGMMLSDFVDDADGLTDDDVLTLLSAGTNIQTTTVGDACGVLGMRFPGTIAPGEKKSFMVVIGVAADATAAAALVRETILEPNSVHESPQLASSVRPNPAYSEVLVEHDPRVQRILVVDALGNIVSTYAVNTSASETVLDVSALASGAYYLILQTQNTSQTRPLMVVR